MGKISDLTTWWNKSNLEVIQEQIYVDTGVETDIWVSIQEASLILNRSERTIHRRIKTGSLPSKHVGKRIQVAIPATLRANDVAVSAFQTVMNGLVEQLKCENTFLRSQIEETNTANAELRRIMCEDRVELNELRERIRIRPSLHNDAEEHGLVRAAVPQTQEGIREIVRLRLSQIQKR